MRHATTALLAAALLIAPAAAPPLRAGGPTPAAHYDPHQPMPATQIGWSSLEAVLDLVHQKQPAFRYVVFRQPGVPESYPQVPPMSLDGLTVGQFLDLIRTECPGIDFRPLAGGDPAANPLFVVGVAPSGDAGAAAVRAAQQVTHQADEPPVVRVFRLTDVVDRLAMKRAYAAGPILQAGTNQFTQAAVDKYRDLLADARRTGLDDVLSLVQATLDATVKPNALPATLKVHPATESLIVKGSAEQVTVVETTLAELKPDAQESQQLANWTSGNFQIDYNATMLPQLNSFRQDAEAKQADVDRLNGQVEQLHRQVSASRAEHARAATGPAPTNSPTSSYHPAHE